MPIISRIGARSWRVRLIYGSIYTVLTLGALTMVYPFLLMLSGSVKSEADMQDITPWPKFWVDDVVLFQKYVESKHNVQLDQVESTWGRPLTSWQRIVPPEPSPWLEDYLAWRKTPEASWWWLGHTGGGQMLPVNARMFRQQMIRRFEGDTEAFHRASGLPLPSWNALVPPSPNPSRFSERNTGLQSLFTEFAQARPIRDRVIENVDGAFRHEYLIPLYGRDIQSYNEVHQTTCEGYRDIFLSERIPVEVLAARDWETYVRKFLPLRFIRLDDAASPAYLAFLSESKYTSVTEYNRAHASSFDSFSEIPFYTSLPPSRAEQLDWSEFIASDHCSVAYLSVYGPRQAFTSFLADRNGVHPSNPVELPLVQADWHDAQNHVGELRWEFSTRNYRQVMDYLLLHGRGIPNTLIYCVLAVGLALVVNPLAAYALSRFKPPGTYNVLLFCMATMAFPGEVTMIPAFLLLKGFPLWPLLAGVGVSLLIVVLYIRWGESLKPWVRWLLTGLLVVSGAAMVWNLAVALPQVSLLNTFAALVFPGMANGYLIFLLKGFFDSLPKEIYESAEIDGAGEWTKFWHFTMSLSKPVLAVVALGAFVSAYSQFMMALIIIPDPKMWTIMVWLFHLQSEAHPSVMYASLAIAAVPTLLVFALCQNIIIRGIVVPMDK